VHIAVAVTTTSSSAIGGFAKDAMGAVADKTGISDAVGGLKGKLSSFKSKLPF
jgi:hypothetical protein